MPSLFFSFFFFLPEIRLSEKQSLSTTLFCISSWLVHGDSRWAFIEGSFILVIFLQFNFTVFTLASLPFRFKGSDGPSMAPTQTVHHHRSTTKKANKSYKTRHASKGALKEQDKGTCMMLLP